MQLGSFNVIKTSSTEIGKKVHKHVAAIHCSGELTLFQRKIINCLLFNAFPNLETENQFKIHIRDLLDLMGLKNNDYQYLRDAFKNIRRTDITWNLTRENFSNTKDEGFEPWLECGWLSWAMSDGATIHYEFPEPLKAYLVEPTVYASISLSMQKKFTSKFALILYENCLRYIKIGKTKTFDIDTFRKIMGVKDGQYKVFRDFNNRVLKPAINQINELTDINVEPVKKRVKRRVVEIKFIVTPKKSKLPQKEKADLNLSKYKGPLVNGVPKSVVEKHARPGETYEQASMRILRSSAKEKL
tara:strand:+ start:3669 stop:4568 length:900 start_codon:yes stop_codon:yes gene_type:complete